MSTLFRPVRGLDTKIQEFPYNEGYVYFATDSGRIYIDSKDERSVMGGSGAAIYYADTTAVENEETAYYYLPISGLENTTSFPKVDDLILNSDGCFYRIEKIEEENFVCERLAVSGSGTGGGGTIRPTIALENWPTSVFVNGQDVNLYFTANSYRDEATGNLYDEYLTVNWTLSTNEGVTYHQAQQSVMSGVRSVIELGSLLRSSTTSILSLTISGMNHEASVSRSVTITMAELSLEYSSTFSNTIQYTPSTMTFPFNVVGKMKKVLEVYFDDVLDSSRTLEANQEGSIQVKISPEKGTHGYHTVRVELHQLIGEDKGLSVEPLQFEIAVKINGNEEPIIWLGDYKTQYYNYDSIQIPFMVYDPNNTTSVDVTFYKDNVEINERTITQFSGFNIWEIADAEIDVINYYQLSVGEGENKVIREISFTVVQDPNRSMTYAKQENLVLNFNATGRSNDEAPTKRKTWTNGTVTAEFENFNWYNNGWMMDDENRSFLRISNGASLTLPIGEKIFGGNQAGQEAHSFEMQIKAHNIQNYTNLIKNITRYVGDGEWYAEFKAQSQYSNYDAFLQYWLKPAEYEALTFEKVQKEIDLNNMSCGYYSASINEDGTVTGVNGLCVGTQDALFSNGTNTVNVNFVEDDLVTISAVYSKAGLMYIYINGVITGVIQSTEGFKISSNELIFNSEHCDIDLYNLRIYDTELNVDDIVNNYTVDLVDITNYDLRSIATENNALGEYQISYKKMLEYNDEHPNDPIMPYIIFDTSANYTDGKLPWSKAKDRTIAFSFVNTTLDRAYTNGELEELAIKDGLCSATSSAEDKAAAVRLYYKHHCPSWTSSMQASDFVTCSVQGTSSEFYPRRNFKIKTKAKGNFCYEKDEVDESGNTVPVYKESSSLNIFLNKGPYASIYASDLEQLLADDKYLGYEESRMADGWYMNNYTNPTDRWTLKVDYMESSGSYNAGFASMMGQAYSKHPLKDYIDKSCFSGTSSLASEIGSTIRWEDYRTSLLGYPVMAFHKTGESDEDVKFIGYYRMLLDKGSDEVLGFKTPKDVKATLLDGEKVRDIAECWEFATNARTFCSFKDPYDRVQLSFKMPVGASDEYTADGAPQVVNHYEYRYSQYEDWIDLLFSFNSLTQKDLDEINDEFDTSITLGDKAAGQELLLSFYSNWEKANQWVWSTCTENVVSQGVYVIAPVGDKEYEPNIYYILESNTDDEGITTTEYVICEELAWDAEKDYFSIVTQEDGTQDYVKVFVTTKNYLYTKNKFYQNIDDAYSLVSDDTFNSSMDYYELIENDTYPSLSNLLVEVCNDETFDENKVYYTFDPSVTNKEVRTGVKKAVNEIELTADTYSAGEYYVAKPVTFDGIEYHYDTQEYRAAKFIHELTDHFDPEYMATYFIMTEVFECYDSRGKNCMMASWGPQTAGGDYIWYPIFYDIDTQLGINNTGIPSFEYNVDATEAGNYSTNDSILWNNFYRYFKNSYILSKYKHLKGVTDNTVKWDALTNPPLQYVDYIESWYRFDPDVTKNIATRGQRPLIATNLDEWFKYITITNSKSIAQGVGYLDGEGEMIYDKNGAFYYALQGDRSQSRRQFLTNRLEYIDSWLNQGNYARGGTNRVRGRVAANSMEDGEFITSDHWVETDTDPYWVNNVEFGTKTHEFDAHYWLDLTPIRSSYVTAGDDSANYPSEKYDGRNTVHFKLSAIESGVRKSAGYGEQLVYIYGLNQLSDLGDMKDLYWTEFFLEGNAPKLTRLKLGHDGLDDDGNNWYNKKLNGITLPDLPLLKEANFCNITLKNETSLDLSKSEKLENFRATGSTISQVSFADGVALNTLYLPSTISALRLTEANLLTDLIEDYEYPTKNDDGTLNATPGLYLEGFFDDTYNSSIATIELRGGSLGYNSYKILKKFYDQKKSGKNNKITLADVNWCPYEKLGEGDIYIEEDADLYYIDNGHYGFDTYEYSSLEDYNINLLSGNLYKKNTSISDDTIALIDDKGYEMFIALMTSEAFTDITATKSADIGGIIYFDNTYTVDEEYIRNTLQNAYPDLKIFFKTVTKAYSAKFVYKNAETGALEYVEFADGSSAIASVQKVSQSDFNDGTYTWFPDDPYKIYSPKRTHYDFLGWSTSTSKDDIISQEDWFNQKITLNNFDYIFYAIFVIHSYNITFENPYDESFGNGTGKVILTIPYGTVVSTPEEIPYRPDDELALESTYGFLGYNLSVDKSTAMDLTTYKSRADVTFYPIFKEMSVYDNVHPEFFTFEDHIYSQESSRMNNVGYESLASSPTSKQIQGYAVTPAVTLKGKITIPAFKDTTDTLPVIALGDFVSNSSQITHLFFEKDSTVYEIMDRAFMGMSSLVYVDFATTNSVRYIGLNTFQNCSLEAKNFQLSDKCFYIGTRGFNAGIVSDVTTTIYIPSSLICIGQNGFAYLPISQGSILSIGEKENKSKLNFNLPDTQETYTRNKFKQNPGYYYSSVIFYSELYDGPSAVAGDTGYTVGGLFESTGASTIQVNDII